MKNMLAAGLLALTLLAFPAFAENADKGLYDPVAPKGAVFLRFFNTQSTDATVSAAGKSYGSLKPLAASPYYVQKKGDISLDINGKKADTTVDADQYYTAVTSGDSVVLIKDQALANRAKALVLFYNLTDKDKLTLKTADGKVEVIPAQAKGASAGREMNGVKVTFGVFDGDTKLAELPESLLERGKAYSVIATAGADGKTVLTWAESKTDTTK